MEGRWHLEDRMQHRVFLCFVVIAVWVNPMLCHAVPFCAMLHHSVPCCAVLCLAVPCYAMLRHAVTFCAVPLCLAVLCHAVPCCASSSRNPWSFWSEEPEVSHKHWKLRKKFHEAQRGTLHYLFLFWFGYLFYFLRWGFDKLRLVFPQPLKCLDCRYVPED